MPEEIHLHTPKNNNTLQMTTLVIYVPFLTHQKMTHRKGLVNSTATLR